MDGLTFPTLRAANIARQADFAHSAHWLLAQWANAVTGELGEACNLIKKYDRGDMTLEELAPLLAEELADIQTYLDMLAYHAGIDLGAATIGKWNRVSIRVGSRVRLIRSVILDHPAVILQTDEGGGP